MLRATRLIRLLGIAGLLFLGLITTGVMQDGSPAAHAIIGMTWGLVLLWVVCGGLLMRYCRDAVRERAQGWPLGWRAKFVLMAVGLALLEEAVTVSMTNLAPLFGVRMGEAYITASADYLDVVLFHSVIVFVPMFAAWAWLLSRWEFSPAAVFLLFGISGTLAESISFGAQSLLNLGLWTFVYGLMVYLPAYCVPAARNAQPPRFYGCAVAVILPILCAIPVALVVGSIHPTSIHFAPIH
jgi:hypothetical protein